MTRPRRSPRTLLALACAAATCAGFHAPAKSTAAPAAGSLPRTGVLVPGTRLGGIALGITKRAVRTRWGARYGICASCATETWYFTYEPFTHAGAAVSFRRGVVTRVTTIWQPEGWRTSHGLELGATVEDLRAAFPDARVTLCEGYEAHLLADPAATAFYVVDDRLWGFGIAAPASPACPG